MNLFETIHKAEQSGTWLAYRKAARTISTAVAAKETLFSVDIKMAFLSTFTVEPLVDFFVVEGAAHKVAVEHYIGGYDQVEQEILNPESRLYSFSPQITVLLPGAEWIHGDSEQRISHLSMLVQSFKKNCKGVLVLCNLLAVPCWPFHITDDLQVVMVRRFNERLWQSFSDDPQVQVCDIDTLAAYYGYRESLSPQMEAMGKIPFSEPFLRVLAKKLFSHVRSAKGLFRKCIVLDCDNTLWGGIIGEDGMEGIHLGPDWPGREYVAFQSAVLELYNQGVILAINSKNNYDDVIKVIREHPHMVLRENHFAAIAVNWEDKASNMLKLAEEIGIGVDSFVFIDDNPVERAMMKQMLPQVCTVELPSNPSLYARTLRETNEFAVAYLTEDDRNRGRMYAEQRSRNELQKSSTTLEEFLRSLDMVVTICEAGSDDIKRVSQLTQRTNQFNATTRRYTETEIKAMLDDSAYRIYVLKLRDKFGDNGTVGVAIVKSTPEKCDIDTFLMSCRVIGRKAEDIFVQRILADAFNGSAKVVNAEYIPTKKNGLVAGFWDQMGFERDTTVTGGKWQFHRSKFVPRTFEYIKEE